jgi:hypothetical protein
MAGSSAATSATPAIAAATAAIVSTSDGLTPKSW